MFVTTLLVCVLALQEPKPDPNDPKRIEAAVVELTTAFAKDGSPDKRVLAIQNSVAIVDVRVIEWVAKGLADKDGRVAETAIDALGRMPHPNALDALHSYYKREKKKLADDEKLLPLLFKSIGRQGHPSSIEVLADDPFAQRAYTTVQARIMALGNIRTTEAAQALIEMSKLVGPRRMEGTHGDFRLALARLTGRDLGPAPENWQKWWQDNKKTVAIAREAPVLETPLQRQWDRYWGNAEKGADKGGKGGDGEGRGKRGGDGEGGGGGDKKGRDGGG